MAKKKQKQVKKKHVSSKSRVSKKARGHEKRKGRSSAGAHKKAPPKKNKKKEAEERELDGAKINALFEKGKTRGFITYGEILNSFPRIENNILLLEELYQKLEAAGIDVLEEKGFIDFEEKEDKPVTKKNLHG